MEYIALNDQWERVELFYNPSVDSWCIFVRKLIEPERWFGYYALGVEHEFKIKQGTTLYPVLTPELIEIYTNLVNTHVNYGR